MLVSTLNNRRLAALASACLLSVALPALPAWAQKTKTKDAAPAQTSTSEPDSAAASEPEFTIDIPTIDAAGSSLDEQTLRDIFSGNVVDHAETLASLTASSITIPQINVTGSSTIDDEKTEINVTFSDIVLSDVTDGTAALSQMASAKPVVGVLPAVYQSLNRPWASIRKSTLSLRAEREVLGFSLPARPAKRPISAFRYPAANNVRARRILRSP